MKQFSLVVLLSITCLIMHAQTPFQMYTPTATTPSGSQFITEDATSGHIGIGLSATPTAPLQGALNISDQDFPATPDVLLKIYNTTAAPTTSVPFPAGNAGVGMAIVRGSAPAPANTCTNVDFMVDGNGLVGIGFAPAIFNSNGTHLGVIDMDPGGTIPLFSVVTNANNSISANTPAMVVDYTGYVTLGASIPATNPARLYISDQFIGSTDPLLSVVTHASAQSLLVASDGKVRVGDIC